MTIFNFPETRNPISSQDIFRKSVLNHPQNMSDGLVRFVNLFLSTQIVIFKITFTFYLFKSYFSQLRLANSFDEMQNGICFKIIRIFAFFEKNYQDLFCLNFLHKKVISMFNVFGSNVLKQDMKYCYFGMKCCLGKKRHFKWSFC